MTTFAIDPIAFARATATAIRLCKEHNETEAAEVLADFVSPIQLHITMYLPMMMPLLTQRGIDMNKLLEQCREANLSGDILQIATANAALAMATMILTNKPNKAQV